MADLRVERWHHDGQERVYISRVADGEAVGWYDSASGEIKLMSVADRHAAMDALDVYLGPPPTPGTHPAPAPPAPSQSQSPDLPPPAGEGAPGRAGRDGPGPAGERGRGAASPVQAPDPAGTAPPSGPCPQAGPSPRAAGAPKARAEAVPARGTDPVTEPGPAPAPPPAPAPGPTADLAANAPGDTVRRLIAEHRPSRLKRAVVRRRGTDDDLRSWETALRGERVTGASLNKLRRGGWYVLHSVPLPGGAGIDHLAIGPPGVFSVTTRHHPGAELWVGDHVVMVDGRKTQYVPESVEQAELVARSLGTACGFEVEVRPVLAFVGVAGTTEKTVIPSVLPVDGTRTHQRLSGLAPALAPDKAEKIFAAARNPRTWLWP